LFPLFVEVADACGLKRHGNNWYSRHPLAHLVELADDFCYALLDLEDGLEMGILSWAEMFDVIRPVLDQSKVHDLEVQLNDFGPGRRPPLIRGKVITTLVEDAAKAFVEHENEILGGGLHELLAICSPNVRDCVKNAKQLAKDKIFVHPRKIELEIGAYATMATLLSTMCHAVLDKVNGKSTDYKTNRALDLIGQKTFDPRAQAGYSKCSPLYLHLMRVLDFVSGMTDNYAVHIARQFSGLGEH
jgi:dGTPase